MCGNVPFATRLARERGVGKPFPFELGRVFSLSLVPRVAVVAAVSMLSPGLSSAGNFLPRPRCPASAARSLGVELFPFLGSSPSGPSSLEVTAFHLGILLGFFP